MAKLYGEIASSALMTFDKSFARANGQPLDSTEVYYSLAAAQEYAAGAGAYVGQKIVVVENGVVTHYGIENEAGALKELGSKPVGDNSSIVVAENGTISLKGIGTLVFERDILDENDEPTGEKEAVQYQPLMTAAGLVWVEPSKTTVEGLATLIDGLSVRVKALEDDRVTEAELAAAVKVEADRALAAEEALGKKIDAIDFVDEDELAGAISAARTEISKEIDDDVKVAKDRADEAYTLAEGKVDAGTYATDKKALQDEDKAIREIAEGVRDAFNTFMNSEDIDDTVNTLKEVQAEIAKMTDATELELALSNKADKTYVDEELDKKQNVIAENTYDAYGSAAAAETAAKSHADSVAATAKSEAIEAAATAAAGLYATQTRVNELETALDGRLDTLEAINHGLYATKEELTAHDNAAKAAYATKDELKATDDVAKDAQSRVDIVEGKIDEITSVGGEPNVVEKIKVNGVTLEVEKDAEGKSTKSVNIPVPTKFTDITDDSGFNARITAAQNAADAAQGTANDAKSAAAQAQREVDDLETVVGGIQNTVAGHTTTIGDHGTRIGALEQADIAHATEYGELKTVVTGHTESLAKKAEASDLNNAVAKIGTNEADIKTLKETTIPGINGEIAKKANSADVYTKSEVNAITGTVAEGKTIVKMIEEAKSDATYNDSEIRGLIKNNADAIEGIYKVDGETKSGVLATEIARVEGLVSTEVGRAQSAESTLSGRLDTVEAFWKEALRDGDEKNVIDTLREIQEYIESDESGASAMAASIKANEDAIAAIFTAGEGETSPSGVLVNEIARVEEKIDENTSAIAAINDKDTGILANANKYTDDAIAGLPAATVDALGLVKYDGDTIKMNDSKQLYVAKVSTDVLVQGTETLILNGGSAIA